MTTIIRSFLTTRVPALTLMLSMLTGAFTPAFAVAASSTSNPIVTASATITATSLTAKSNSRIVIAGTTQNTAKVRFTIKSEGSTRTLFKSKILTVRNGQWSSSVSKKLKDGKYTVTVYNASGKHDEKLIDGTLVVGAPAAILKVAPIALLTGGTAQPGQTIPVSYLQVVNQGSSTVAIRGFSLEQRGTAADASITGFSSVDGSGGSRASTTASMPLSKGKAYVPTAAVLAPGERKLFTIKANVSPRVGTYAGQTLMLNVTGVDADATFNATFPITGTTWTIGR